MAKITQILANIKRNIQEFLSGPSYDQMLRNLRKEMVKEAEQLEREIENAQVLETTQTIWELIQRFRRWYKDHPECQGYYNVLMLQLRQRQEEILQEY